MPPRFGKAPGLIIKYFKIFKKHAGYKHSSLFCPPEWITLMRPILWTRLMRRHDTQHNDTQHSDIQHNDTQHKRLICGTQHIKLSAIAIQNCHYAECNYTDCRALFIVMLNVVMLSVVVPLIMPLPNKKSLS